MNVEKLVMEPEARRKYHNEISKKLKNLTEKNIKWQNIVNLCTITTKEVVGKLPRNKKLENTEKQKKSIKRHNLRIKIITCCDSLKNEENIKRWKKKRMTLLNEIEI